MLTKTEKKIVNFIQGDLPLEPAPFAKIAGMLGITEEELVKKITGLKKQGYIRRLGAVLNHRKIGLTVNCMCVWDTPKDRVENMARICKTHPMITHCYLRKKQPGWPYNFYTMIHAGTREECARLVKFISRKSQVSRYEMLFTQKEFKKTSPKYSI